MIINYDGMGSYTGREEKYLNPEANLCRKTGGLNIPT